MKGGNKILIMGCFIGLAGGTSCMAASKKRPNIILINIDDLGWSDVQYNDAGHYYETPNIDRLRQSGVNFSYAYAGAANSAPSRACLLSGQNTPRHGVYTVSPPDRGRAEDRRLVPYPNCEVLDSTFITLPQALQKLGYHTCHIGKWHIGYNPLAQGMDVNIGGNHAGHPASYFSPYKNPDLQDGPEGEYLMDRLSREAENYIDTVDRSRPFFLYYASYAVHAPLQAKAELVEKYRKKKTSDAHFNPVYAAMVENMDMSVGRILDAVERNGLTGNTLVVFTSDNGGPYEISHQWPLRAGKGSFYEGGIRIPFIVYMHGKYEGGKETTVPVSHLDLYPTFVEFAGGRKDKSLDGLSLLPLLDKGKEDYLNERSLYFHFPAYLENGNVETRDRLFRTRPVSVLIKDGWKLIENYEDGVLELYDVRNDVSERFDRAGDEPVRTKCMLEQLNSWKQREKAPIPMFK